MNFPRRSALTGNNELQDVWIRIFPVQNLNNMILDTLSTSPSLPDFQKITVAKFTLKEIINWQGFNKKCLDAGHPEYAEPDELKTYLTLFERILSSIISEESADSDLKIEFIEFVWNQKEDGIVDFGESQVHSILLRTVSEDRLENLLLDALASFTESSTATFKTPTELIQMCSPAAPSNFQNCMKNLCAVFIQSHFHFTILDFTRLFIQALYDRYRLKIFNLIPIRLRTSVVISWLLRDSYSGNLSIITKDELKLLLSSLDSLYIDCNFDDIKGAHATLVSFYLASVCKEILDLIRSAYDKNIIQYPLYPWLWLYLRKVRFSLQPETILNCLKDC